MPSLSSLHTYVQARTLRGELTLGDSEENRPLTDFPTKPCPRRIYERAKQKILVFQKKLADDFSWDEFRDAFFCQRELPNVFRPELDATHGPWSYEVECVAAGEEALIVLTFDIATDTLQNIINELATQTGVENLGQVRVSLTEKGFVECVGPRPLKLALQHRFPGGVTLLDHKDKYHVLCLDGPPEAQEKPLEVEEQDLKEAMEVSEIVNKRVRDAAAQAASQDDDDV